MYDIFDRIQQDRERFTTRLAVPTCTNLGDASTVNSELTYPTLIPMEHSASPGDNGSEIDLETKDESNSSSHHEEEPSNNNYSGRELIYPTLIPMELSSYPGDDGSEIDLETNSESNFSSYHEEEPSKNKYPGKGNTRHERCSTYPEQPKTYLPSSMLAGNTGSNSDEVMSESTSVHTDNDRNDDLVSMEYSEYDSVHETAMPMDQTVMDKFPEEHPHPLPKRNLLYRRYIGATIVAIVIIVTVVVILLQKKNGSSSIKVPDVVSPSLVPTAAPGITQPASPRLTTSPISLSPLAASSPPVANSTSRSPVVASSPPVTSPTTLSPVVASSLPVTSPTSLSPVVPSTQVTSPTALSPLFTSLPPVTSPNSFSPVVGWPPPESFSPVVGWPLLVTSPDTFSPVVSWPPAVTSPDSFSPVVV